TTPTAPKPATPTPANSTPTPTSTSYSTSTTTPSPTPPDTPAADETLMTTRPQRRRTVDPAGLTSLRFIGDAMRRRAWVWCGAGMAGLVIGAALYVLAPTAYQAQTSILVTSNSTEDSGTQIEGDVEIAQNAQVAEGAMDELGSQQSVGAFLASYTVTAVSDQILQITAKAGSSDAAIREARAVAAVFLNFRTYELTTQQRLGMTALRSLIASHRQQFRSLTAKLARVTAEPNSRARKIELRRLRKKYRKASIALGALGYTLTNYPALTQSMVKGTQVLDPAAPIPPSRRHIAVINAIAGLICGLGIGLSIVVASALISDRPRRRDDVARMLGSVVRSVDRPRLTGVPLRGRGRIPVPRGEIHHLSNRLREAIPDRGRTALAVVAVDSVRPAAMA